MEQLFRTLAFNLFVNDPQAKSKIETASGVVAHSYLGNQTRKARRALETSEHDVVLMLYNVHTT